MRVERDPGMSADELAAFADEALAGLEHRRVDIEDADAAVRLRPSFEALGWMTQRLVWMRHGALRPPGPDLAVEEVPYEAVRHLRIAWHGEDFPGIDIADYLHEAREVATMLAARLAVRQGGDPLAFAQLERHGRSAEISLVYVRPEHRGRGLGTALTCAAIDAAGDVDDLWIVADDEGRPKQLYARLGFRGEWTAVEALRLARQAFAGAGGRAAASRDAK